MARRLDWCGGRAEGLDQETTYQQMAAANKAASAVTGRKLVLSFCEWGTGLPWNWATGYGDLWRTSHDVLFYKETPGLTRMYRNFRRAQPAAHEPVVDRRYPAARGQQRGHDDHRDP
ncbi:hypothetical protein [Streptomyces sp. TRM70350]|uniref:hypothetical protein n=1 Tax=Streptomyces sp. TRM70350 TaxID=2856165 RepID=UPI0021108C94|nr:hypothetical protein [Streptomyces sp. TRM70350]